MKIIPAFASVFAVVCMAASGLPFVASQKVAEVHDEAGFALDISQDVKMTPVLRRELQISGGGTSNATTINTSTGTASPTTAPTTTAPEPSTEAPSTRAPTPATAAPTTSAPPSTTTPPTTNPPTTNPPVTDSPPTNSPDTNSPTTEAPTSPAPPPQTPQTPDATTAAPTSTPAAPNTSPESTPTAPTTETPSTTTAPPPTASNTPSSPSDPSISTPPESATMSNSGSGSGINAEISSKSSMSTGAVIAIVVGIVAAVAVIATIIMCVIRRRREVDDDPLSPFELSMDKSYNPPPNGYNAHNVYNQCGMGAANTSVSGHVSNTQTSPADTVVAGLAYSQYYDQAATSPGSMNRLNGNGSSAVGNDSNTATNLWLSAMEPKDNESYLSAQDSPPSSRNGSRNSYEVTSSNEHDMEVSSQISGHSITMSDDFPDHNEDNDSARGSYEL